MKTIVNWINGADDVIGAPATQPVHDPATGQVTAHLALSGPDAVDRAVRAAVAAQRDWGRAPIARRTDIMFALRQLVLAHIDELALIISHEHGKTIADARGEVSRGLETVEFACGLGANTKGEYTANASSDVDVYSMRQPLGVVAGITPFNFPAMVPMWMFPVAIATGNAFILKPSERDPSAANYIAALFARAGLPDGVFQVIHGGKDAVDALLTHPGIAAVSFVGSTPVARYVQQTAIASGKRVQALGGANNHGIVMPDADLDFAATQIVSGAFGSAGQRCMALPVVIAVGDIADDLVALLRQKAGALRVGAGYAAGTDMGPVITAAARQRVIDFTTEAEAGGASVVLDGRTLVVEGLESGYFVGPTILDHVRPDMRAYCEEVFGPLLAVLRVASYEEAIELVNSSPFGNGAAIFTASGEYGRQFAQDVQAGMVGINVPIPTPVAYYSFGGWKDSLFGDHHAHGPEGVRFYTRNKVITSRWPHQGVQHRVDMNFPTMKS